MVRRQSSPPPARLAVASPSATCFTHSCPPQIPQIALREAEFDSGDGRPSMHWPTRKCFQADCRRARAAGRAGRHAAVSDWAWLWAGRRQRRCCPRWEAGELRVYGYVSSPAIGGAGATGSTFTSTAAHPLRPDGVMLERPYAGACRRAARRWPSSTSTWTRRWWT